MKHLFVLLVALLFGRFCSGQTVTVQAEGSPILPSHGAVGVTLIPSVYGAELVNCSWYKRTNGIDTQLPVFSNWITVFLPGDYWVEAVVRVKVSPFSSYLKTVSSTPYTVQAAVPTLNTNTVVSTTVLHEGVKTANHLSDIGTSSHGANSISYLDGFGRPVQTVACQASPSKTDVVQPIVYDAFDRQPVAYLPYTGTNTGNMHPNALSEQSTFYATTGQNRATSTVASASVVFEKSPLNTVLEQGGVGTAYQLGTDKTSKASYRTNLAGEVAYWTYDATSTQATGTSTYPEGTLSVQETRNAHNQTTRSYQDKSGRIVLRKYLANPTATANDQVRSTYYVYDAKGRLVYEVSYLALSKLGAPTNWTFNSNHDVCKYAMHYYQYDALDRAWYHRPPEREPIYTVYDRLNRPILTQNGEQRKTNDWSFSKFDRMGRVVLSGTYKRSYSVTPSQLQALSDVEVNFCEERKANTTHGYTEHLSFPRTTSTSAKADVLAVYYYDDYDFNRDLTNDVALKAEPLLDPALVPDYNVQGKAVATKTKVLGEEKWLWSVAFFDERGRFIQTRRNTHPDAYAATTSLDVLLTNTYSAKLDFLGKCLKSVERHTNSAAATNLSVTKRYTYDHAGRLLGEYQQNNTDAEICVKRLKYNELGQVVEKNLHEVYNGFLQSVDYTYNIQGRVTHINNPQLASGYGSNNNDTDDKFGLQLYYEDTETNFTTGNAPTPRYDGNISAVKWRSNNTDNVASDKNYQLYAYGYSGLGDYTSATLSNRSSEASAWTTGALFKEQVSYENWGNAKGLLRWNKTGSVMDNLEYMRSYHQIGAITEIATRSGGFPSNSSYLYNSNGHLKEDVSRRLTITYNHLDLVDQIVWKKADGTEAGRIKYSYDAGGTMLRKKHTVYGGAVTTTDYVGAFCYQNNVLQFLNHSEGRVVRKSNGALQYEYALRDHQGYARAFFTDADNNGVAEVLQEDHYYPSGPRWESSWTSPATSTNRFGLQGKEWMSEGFTVDGAGVPLDWYDFGARMYDPAAMTWWAQDPALQYENPYAYCGNDPVNYIDPDGNWSLFNDMLGRSNKEAKAAGYENGLSDMAIHIAKINTAFVASIAAGAGIGSLAATTGSAAKFAWMVELGASMASGAVAGGGMTWANGGDGHDIIMAAGQGAIIGAISHGISKGIGYGLDKLGAAMKQKALNSASARSLVACENCVVYYDFVDNTVNYVQYTSAIKYFIAHTFPSLGVAIWGDQGGAYNEMGEKRKFGQKVIHVEADDIARLQNIGGGVNAEDPSGMEKWYDVIDLADGTEPFSNDVQKYDTVLGIEFNKDNKEIIKRNAIWPKNKSKVKYGRYPF